MLKTGFSLRKDKLHGLNFGFVDIWTYITRPFILKMINYIKGHS